MLILSTLCKKYTISCTSLVSFLPRTLFPKTSFWFSQLYEKEHPLNSCHGKCANCPPHFLANLWNTLIARVKVSWILNMMLRTQCPHCIIWQPESTAQCCLNPTWSRLIGFRWTLCLDILTNVTICAKIRHFLEILMWQFKAWNYMEVMASVAPCLGLGGPSKLSHRLFPIEVTF